MKLSLFHWYPGSGVVLDVSIPDLCPHLLTRENIKNLGTRSFVQIMPVGLKWPKPWGHIFYIGLYRENINKSSWLKPQGLEP